MRNSKLSLLSLVVFVVMLMGVSVAGATSIIPVLYTNNPDFEDLGYAHGYTIDSIVDGTYNAGPGDITVQFFGTAGMVGYLYFDWTSTFGIDAVIVVGHVSDPGYADVYFYTPPGPSSFGDTGLAHTGPVNIIGVEFCWNGPTQAPEPATLLLLGLSLAGLARLRRKS